MKHITNNFEESQKIGEGFAKEILASGLQTGAVVLALSGDLGAGKTTFLQGFAKGLGIDEVVNSPTFVIMKKFKIPSPKPQSLGPVPYHYFYHFDCYRLESEEDVKNLNFTEIISDPKNIVAIEWPEKISTLLPKNNISIKFEHLEESKREIIIGKL